MNRIVLTGDTHADITRLLMMPDEGFTKEDFVIVLGDFGVFWDNKHNACQKLAQLAKKNFTVAFVDGNHENFNLIKEMETLCYWKGGYIGLLPFGAIHLLRGEIYQIGDKRIGVCGGAESIDKDWRIENESWWAAEKITDLDVENFKRNLKDNKKIDLMLSHDCPASITKLVGLYSGVNSAKISSSQMQLEHILAISDIKKWYFGHWHIDMGFGSQFECLYKSFKEV